MRQTVPSITTFGDIGVNIRSFTRSLRSENLSARTVETYTEAATQFSRFLGQTGMLSNVAEIRGEHVEAFVTNLLGAKKATTANNRFRGLQRFFGWLVEEGEIRTSPITNMTPPRISEAMPDVLREHELRSLLATCSKGHGFEDRRDYALMLMFMKTSSRLAEVAGLHWDPDDPEQNDVDLDQGILRVMGKGRRERVLAIERKAAQALDRYLRVRQRHPTGPLLWLWLGLKARLTHSGKH